MLRSGEWTQLSSLPALPLAGLGLTRTRIGLAVNHGVVYSFALLLGLLVRFLLLRCLAGVLLCDASSRSKLGIVRVVEAMRDRVGTTMESAIEHIVLRKPEARSGGRNRIETLSSMAALRWYSLAALAQAPRTRR
jgi:hypothetical protein